MAHLRVAIQVCTLMFFFKLRFDVWKGGGVEGGGRGNIAATSRFHG